MNFDILKKYEGMDNAEAFRALSRDTPWVRAKECSVIVRTAAIFAAIVTVGLALLSKRCLEACRGYSCVKLEPVYFEEVAKELEIDFKSDPRGRIAEVGEVKAQNAAFRIFLNRYLQRA